MATDVSAKSHPGSRRKLWHLCRGRVPIGGSRGVTVFTQPPGLALPSTLNLAYGDKL